MFSAWQQWLRRKYQTSKRQPRKAAAKSSRLLVEPLESRQLLSTFTVTNTNDSGAGSLRQAILDANASPGTDVIAFNIGGGGVQTILPTSPLPAITDPVVLDGTTQPGFAGQPLIVLSGSQAGAGANGLNITAGPSTVRGLVINDFTSNGLLLNGASGSLVTGNYIGTDASGTVAAPNGLAGIFLSFSFNSTIGGTASGAGNLISGNLSDGVLSDSDGSFVQGNRIGTDASGTHALGNGGNGVDISIGSQETIGGSQVGAGNLISGNGMNGVLIGGFSNLVEGNLIGTDLTGTAALGNVGIGVFLFGADNTVGGSVAGAGNLISGNLGDGVLLDNGAELVQGNRIGTDVTGTRALGNGGNGVLFLGASDLVGGTTPGAGNLISGNKLAGVTITSNGFTSNNQVLGNFIGTDASGTQALGNGGGGVRIFGGTSNNTIGGTAAGAGNLISGNGGDGLAIFVSNDLVQGNLIGTDVTGTHALGNQNGLTLSGFASGNTIGGTAAGAANLISGNTGDGILISGSNNLVQGNRVGTDRSGTAALGNGGDGIADLNGPFNTVDNTIGGTAAGAGNLISGNTGHGVLIGGGSNLVQGNRIGTDVSGTAALGNAGGGIALESVSFFSSDNTVGGTAAGAGNLISGNGGDGLFISSSSDLVQGNLIGTDVTGTHALANQNGLTASASASSNTIGGAAGGAGNLISGNTADGILISGSNNLVQGNYIGTDVTGSLALGNGSNGVEAASASSNTIGGTAAGAGNLISGNTADGILISGSNNLVQGNYIGTDVTGSLALGNGSNGVEASGASNTTIGGTTAAARNLISGNLNAGIMTHLLNTGTVVEGNFIGTDVTGTRALGNFFGLELEFESNTTIGGTATGAGNLISGNKGSGLDAFFGQGTVVQGNTIGTDITGTQALGNGSGLFLEFEGNDLIGGSAAGAGNLISANQGAGMVLDSVGGLVQGNTIGTDITGTKPLGNTGTGIQLLDVNGLTVGGTTVAARNLVSANQGDGILFEQNSAGNLVEGNFIGTDISGTVALGNTGNGIEMATSTFFNTIGGTAAGAGNLISGNSQDGVLFSSFNGVGSQQNTVQGNRIGTDITGTIALGNRSNGVEIRDGFFITLGGTTPAAANVISGNGGSGVVIGGAFNSRSNSIFGNFIGTDSSATLALGNGGNGVEIDGSNNSIGSAGRSNVIAFNALDGVFVNSGTGNLISQNSIFSNGGLGIDLNTANNANNSQAAPVLKTAVSADGTTFIIGSLTSTPNTTFTIEFFATPQSGPSGKTFLGSITVTTDSKGRAHFKATFAFAIPPGQFITATATDPGNDTSEFSNSQVVHD